MPSILIFGATGFLGGTIFVALKKSYPDYEIRALVRNPAQNDAVSAAGASVIINAPTRDLAQIESISADADMLVNVAIADDLEFINAMLSGMKSRFEKGDGKAILIHTSGSAVFLDSKRDGKVDPEGKMYTDDTEDDIRAITPQMIHGAVDVAILKAGEEGYINAYIICPAGMPAVGTGPVGRVGGQQIIMSFMIQRGHAFYVGEGSNVLGVVRLDDLTTLYLLVVEKALTDHSLPSLPESPYSRYYIASIQTITWKELSSAYGKILHKHGLIKTAEPKSIALEEAGPFGFVLAANSYERSVRAIRELGWKPKDSITMDMFEDTAEEAVKAFK